MRKRMWVYWWAESGAPLQRLPQQLVASVTRSHATWRWPVLQRYSCGVAAYWLAAPSVRLGDVISPALRGVPPQRLIQVAIASNGLLYRPLNPLQVHTPLRKGMRVRNGKTLARPWRLKSLATNGRPFVITLQENDLAIEWSIRWASHGIQGSSRRHPDWSMARNSVASVANSWAYLTQHLPLTVFLTLSGAYTLNPLEALFHATTIQDFQH